MLSRIDVDGASYRVNARLTRTDLATFREHARTVSLTGDDRRDAKAVRPLLRLLIDRRDWNKFWTSSIERRRGYQAHKAIAQHIIDGCGFGDILETAG